MGSKPPAVADAAAALSASSETTAAYSRFGMPHACVIITFVITAALLAPRPHALPDVLALLAGSGGIGAAVVVLAVMPGRGAGRLGRLMRAYFSAGN
ncbi:hypothetical protein [Streptomyces fuscichromogenes]|uniref:Uncharacterized protein n=1 Tax=Streptomyces fuscichromogenes TaxID=1324013 RepID=A0A917XP59_9ACTN|nr:hypothetical protein [Streptomyces fuscichromogenes]GGN45768.1 hypothetical protein GCM10011578_098010 [Streptomyces fuscichromogenes]